MQFLLCSLLPFNLPPSLPPLFSPLVSPSLSLSLSYLFDSWVITFYCIPTNSLLCNCSLSMLCQDSIPFYLLSFRLSLVPISSSICIYTSMVLSQLQMSLSCSESSPKGQTWLFNSPSASLPASAGLRILLFSVSSFSSHLSSVCKSQNVDSLHAATFPVFPLLIPNPSQSFLSLTTIAILQEMFVVKFQR